MKKFLIACPLLIMLTYLSSNTLYGILKFNYTIENSILRAFLWPVSHTLWSEGFSDKKFRELQIGSTADLILSKLGEPLQKDCNNLYCYWNYTRPGDTNAHYEKRLIVTDRNGNKTDIFREFWDD